MTTREVGSLTEFLILALDSEFEPIDKELVYKVNEASAELITRELFPYLFKRKAASFIVGLNFPGDELAFNSFDLDLITEINLLASIYKIPMNDFLIFNSNKYLSYSDHGLDKTKRPLTSEMG